MKERKKLADRDVSPLSERGCEAVCLGFALWTLCAHLVVVTGGSLRQLIALYVATGVAALLATGWLRKRSPSVVPGEPSPAESEAAADGHALPAWLRPVSLAVAATAALTALLRDDPILTWSLLLLVLGGAAVAHLLIEAPRSEPPRTSRRAELGLIALAIVCAVYALIAHRPDTDDAFYINLAVAAVDLPELPLLAHDTLHGRLDLPLLYPAYRLHSFELWNGAISLLTGVPALYVFHWMSAALAALLVPLCHAVLFRRLTPRIWLWTTLALVVVLIAAGETHRWYGNFAFVRIWQGKAITLFVFMPLVYAFALRFAERGDARSWLRLAAAQVAALGCSSNALWAAPVGALMALCCVLPPTLAGLRRLGVGALASGYLLAAGLFLKSQMSTSMPELARAYLPGVQLADALHVAFGDERLYVVGVASIFLAWVCCPRGVARRFAIALPLAVTLVLLNPWADAWVRGNLTGPYYWRAMWALPAPILMALVAVAPLGLAGAASRSARIACVALLAGFALFVPRFAGYSEENRVRIGWPTAKVGASHRWSTVLNELAPRRQIVAPPDVSAWIPISHDHAYPMVVLHYLQPLREQVGKVAYRDRVVMTQFADGNTEHPRAAAIFERGLDLYDVQAVCIRISDRVADARQILRRAGFVRHIQATDLEIWSRKDS